MKEDFKRALRQFKEKNVAIIGDIMLDRTEWGEISKRINPENQKVNIINVRKEIFYLGGAGNVARNISSLGAKSTLYGVIGNDIYGNRIKELAKESRVNTENLVRINQPTIVKARIFINGDYKHRADLGEKNLRKIYPEIQNELINALKRNIKDYHAIILSDYNKHLFSEDFAKKIINLARERNIPVLVDTKPQNISLFKGAYLVSPNKKEAEEITGIKYKNDKKTLYKIGKKLTEKINSKKAIITLGSEGAYLFDDGNSEMIPAKAKRVVEVTGAGDTFIATLALGVISKLKTSKAVELANCASGIVVEKQGTATTNVSEILQAINQEL
jgi:rfaE bifunctional protein kinase chain/domain